MVRREWKLALVIGLAAFAAPFLGCTATARYLLGWSSDASWLAGIALSTTSVAVVYAVMLEFGLNRTDYGKVVLAACFVNDLATVLALGAIVPTIIANAYFLPKHLRTADAVPQEAVSAASAASQRLVEKPPAYDVARE